jgi:hypothetical protein
MVEALVNFSLRLSELGISALKGSDLLRPS